jgi:hypothetical protein
MYILKEQKTRRTFYSKKQCGIKNSPHILVDTVLRINVWLMTFRRRAGNCYTLRRRHLWHWKQCRLAINWVIFMRVKNVVCLRYVEWLHWTPERTRTPTAMPFYTYLFTYDLRFVNLLISILVLWCCIRAKEKKSWGKGEWTFVTGF